MFDSKPHHLNGKRQMLFRFLKIFLQVPGHLAVRFQTREDIDEPKHLDLERFIGHSGAEDAIVPPAPFKNGRPTS
jgi:hypothetical protein